MSVIPSSWYFAAESKEVKAGQVKRMELFGEPLALWRTESGVLNVTTAICPHLGSDLGKLGKVVGENLQCFSHDYTYNSEGDCVGTGFKTLPCHNKKVLNFKPVHEVNGFIMVWFDAEGKEPTWKMPNEAFSDEGTTVNYVRSDFEFEVPIQTLNEDNFDVGHLYKWHKVNKVETVPVTVDGPMISIAHYFFRHSIIFEKPLPRPWNFFSRGVNSMYSSTLYGHGLTASYINIFTFGVHLQDMIFVTPLSPTRIKYTTFLRRVLPTGERTLVQRLTDTFLQPLIFRASVYRLRQEHKLEGEGFWENQHHVENPILTETEKALIEPYREWCKQFEPQKVESQIKENNIPLKVVA